jgi:LysM repeat protein
MKKILGLLFLLPLFAVAQKVITHTVGPKESLTSIGRLYNINGRELANYNKIDYEKGLTIGQVLKIPVTNAKTTDVPIPPPPAKVAEPVKETVVKAPTVSNEKGTPIYHTVGKKETLYHISTLYNKVPIEDLKKWNNLTSDGLSEGVKLIVGYTGSAPVKTTAEVKPAPVAVKEPVTVAPKPMEEKKPVEIKKEEPKNNEPVKTVTIATKAANFNGGIFKSVYESQTSGKNVITETGAGGIFKSTSGWDDGKYYCLHNAAPAGTVIKVTNTTSGKSIYAKVLDMIPDIKQNSGLIIRISNAAADALGITDNKIDCTLNYSK